LFEEADSLGIPIIVHGASDLLNAPLEFAEMARRFPRVKVVMAHMVPLVRRAFDRREDLRRLDLLEEPRPPAQESRLAYLGHALMENRNGLIVAAEATLATGTAEREAAAAFSERRPEGSTLGADKNSAVEAFVEALKARGIAPHVAINGTVSQHGKARKTAVAPKVAASPGYAISQRLRKRIEECFSAGARRWADLRK
jgi:hypothetical protein